MSGYRIFLAFAVFAAAVTATATLLARAAAGRPTVAQVAPSNPKGSLPLIEMVRAATERNADVNGALRLRGRARGARRERDITHDARVTRIVLGPGPEPEEPVAELVRTDLEQPEEANQWHPPLGIGEIPGGETGAAQCHDWVRAAFAQVAVQSVHEACEIDRRHGRQR